MPTDPATPPNPPQPNTPLCHCQALRQAARRATALYDAAMAPFGLRISQYALLNRLRQTGPMSVQTLATELVLDRTTLGRNLRPLERDGLVTSEPDPTDKRIRRLTLTPKGQTLTQTAAPAWHQAQSTYETQFGPTEAQSLRTALHRLTETLPE